MPSQSYLPIIKKLVYKEGVLVERALPSEGYIHVSVGEVVEPSQKIGTCKVSYELIDLGNKFVPAKKDILSFAKGMYVGRSHGKKFIAPFNGFLDITPASALFKQEARDYWLMPGVWGQVIDISHNQSVLLKTQVLDIHLPIVPNVVKTGELVVFPNPQDILTAQYFEKYLKSGSGKIVYVGNTISKEIISKAAEMDVVAVLAGSASKDVSDFALASNVILGLLSSYGDCPTPTFIYDFINSITSRYVFLFGDKNILEIPLPPDNDFRMKKYDGGVLRYLKKGLQVQVLSHDSFGKIGVVDSVKKSGILVRLQDSEDVIEVSPLSLLAIE